MVELRNQNWGPYICKAFMEDFAPMTFACNNANLKVRDKSSRPIEFLDKVQKDFDSHRYDPKRYEDDL